MFLQLGDTITYRVAGNSQYSQDLIQDGMEIPCILILKRKEWIVDKAKNFYSSASNKTQQLKQMCRRKSSKENDGGKMLQG